MSKFNNSIDEKKGKEIKTLAQFIHIFCRENHGDEDKQAFDLKNINLPPVITESNIQLCSSCNKLLSHGIVKLLMCPYDPKPMCKKCETHCYATFYRQQIRLVMKFSGMYMIKHGRLDMMAHYFLK